MARSKIRFGFILLVVALAAGGFYFARKSGTDAGVYSNDFNVYYFAARETLAGRNPYARSLGEWTPYLYPPLLAELMVPLAWLPLAVAAYIWFLISAAFTLCAAWMAAALNLSEDRHRAYARSGQPQGLPLHLPSTWSNSKLPVQRWLVAAGALVVVLRFVLDTFSYGQVNAIVAGLAVAHIYLYAKDRRRLSLVALVLAVSIKLTPGLLIVYHLARLRLKFALLCVSLLAAVTFLSFLPFGASANDAFKTFVNRTIRNEQGFDLGYAGNQSLRGAVARLAGESEDSSRKPSTPVTLALSIALLLVSAVVARFARTEAASVAPFFCCLVLLSPLSWKAHFVALLLPACFLIYESARSVSLIRRCSLITSLAVTTALFNLTSPRILGLSVAEWADAHSLVFAGTLLLFVTCAAAALWQAGEAFVNLNE